MRVKYVTPEGEIVDALVLSFSGESTKMARVKFGKDSEALTRWSNGKEPNTFHFAHATVAPEAKPFKPGAKARPDQPTKPNGAESARN
jgi:hypothetical protein